MSRPSENIINFSLVSSPFFFHQSIAHWAPISGSPESILTPVHEASQSGALFKKFWVPYVSGNITLKFPSCSSCQSSKTLYGACFSSVSVFAKAEKIMGSSWALVPIASSSRRIAMRQFEVPINFDPMPSHIACTHQSCQRKLCRLLVPKSAILIPSKGFNCSIFSHSFVIALA